MDKLETLNTEIEEVNKETTETPEEATKENEETTDTENIEGANEEDQEQINNFVTMVGGLPEGAQVSMVDGKPTLNMKINGVPTTRTIEDIVRNWSMSEAADQKLEGVKNKEKELKSIEDRTRAFLDELISDPAKYYQYRRMAGIPDSADHEYAAKLLEDQLRMSEMTDEEKELEQLRKEKADWAVKQKEEEDRKKQEADRAEIVKLQEQYSGEVVQALRANGFTNAGDEDTKLDIMQNALYYMMVAKNNKVEFTPDQAVKKAVNDLKGYMITMLGKMPDDLIRKTVPKNVIKALRAGSSSTAGLESTPTSNSLKPATEAVPKKKKGKSQSLDEYFRNI